MSLSAAVDRLDAIAPAFIDAALRGAVVLLIALVLTHLLRRRSAAARHLVWVGAVVIQLALPLFAIWGPKWDLPVSSGIASILPVDLPVGGPAATPSTRLEVANTPNASIVVESSTQSSAAERSVAPPVPAPVAAPVVTGRQILLALWLLGAAVILLRLAVGTSIVATLARKGNRVEDGAWLSLTQRLSNSLGIDRPLTLLRGHKLGVPITWGIVYPVVLLPDDADAWPEERRRFVLVHEMAHVKRLDALTQLAGQFALALFWFNPLVWVANRRMQMEREHACDDYVIRQGTVPSTYAEELLAMVRSLGTSERTTQPAFAALAMARRSEFEGRMLSILDPVLDRHPLSKGRTLLSALAALLLVVPLAALQPYQRTTESAAQPAPPAVTPTTPQLAVSDTDSRKLPDSFKVTTHEGSSLAESILRLDTARQNMKGPLSNLAVATKGLDSARMRLAGETESIATAVPTCDAARFSGEKGGTSAHIHSSDDDGSGAPLLNYTRMNSARCSSATIVGRLTYTQDEDDIVAMPFGAHATFRDRTIEVDRALTVSRLADGALARSYRVNGAAATYDESARAWFAGYLPALLMEAGLNVQPRVTRWMSQGGFDAVLTRIATMTSSSAKRSHYSALLDVPGLTEANLDQVVRHAGRNITSSGDLRAILKKAGPRRQGGIRSGSALEEGIAGLASSGDKTSVLMEFGQTNDRDMLLSVMRVARTIPSSGDKTRLLKSLAPRYLDTNDKDLVAAFYGAALTIPSSGDLRAVLETAIPYTQRSEQQVLNVIAASRSIPSSGDLSEVLIKLVRTGSVRSKDARDAFFAAAATVPSEGDRNRVLTAASRY